MVLLLLPDMAQAAIQPTRAEIVITDVNDPSQTSLDLDILNGRQIAFHLKCRGDGQVVTCDLAQKGRSVGMIGLRPSRALTTSLPIVGASCETHGLRLNLAVSDLIQTRPEPVVDSYRFRVEVEPTRSRANTCPNQPEW